MTNTELRFSNADLLKIHILVYAPINCICLYVLKSCFTGNHADILTYLNSSQHVDHWFLPPSPPAPSMRLLLMSATRWIHLAARKPSNSHSSHTCSVCSAVWENCNEQSPPTPLRDKRVQRLQRPSESYWRDTWRHLSSALFPGRCCCCACAYCQSSDTACTWSPEEINTASNGLGFRNADVKSPRNNLKCHIKFSLFTWS